LAGQPPVAEGQPARPGDRLSVDPELAGVVPAEAVVADAGGDGGVDRHVVVALAEQRLVAHLDLDRTAGATQQHELAGALELVFGAVDGRQMRIADALGAPGAAGPRTWRAGPRRSR